MFGLASMGAFYALKTFFGALKSFTRYCILPRLSLKSRYSGGWAVVTGASDGIGKALAIELAREKFDIVLIARDKAKLDDVAANIRNTYNVQTQVLVFDFSTLGTENGANMLIQLLGEIEGEISIVINNVGMCKSDDFEKL